jgi:3-polyprenyl-4-hydroxybenzoate decarboxylase
MGMAVVPCSMKTLATMATGYPGLAGCRSSQVVVRS